MIQALRNYRSQWWVIDRDMAEHIACIFQEYTYGLPKDLCLQYLETILTIWPTNKR